ncbi:(2Fe-2S)-binding protein [Coralloluteibacterium stylophorae]|uniref:Bacterioferritin-associated ferredoxin n=1 Tax=Coralloluteibacterium stylophorae TaxID=1776034 RepID=A0A8J7VTJ2_9GAMM|nr:(2Fe-2S)-binding protein [Coralloluteibacterium stylophorae]
MYVCICNAITDKDIRRAVEGGCRSMGDLTLRTGCSGTCGSCTGLAEDVLADACAAIGVRVRIEGLALPVAA